MTEITHPRSGTSRRLRLIRGVIASRTNGCNNADDGRRTADRDGGAFDCTEYTRIAGPTASRFPKKQGPAAPGRLSVPRTEPLACVRRPVSALPTKASSRRAQAKSHRFGVWLGTGPCLPTTAANASLEHDVLIEFCFVCRQGTIRSCAS